MSPAPSPNSAPSLSRTRPTSIHPFITHFSNQEERGDDGDGDVAREVPISEMVTYRLYVTRIPIFKAARSRSSRSRLRFLAYYADSSLSWRLLSLACSSFIFFAVTMIDGESALLPRRLYLTRRKLHSLHGLIPRTTKFPRHLVVVTRGIIEA